MFAGSRLFEEAEARKAGILRAINSASSDDLGEGTNEEVATKVAQRFLFPEDLIANYDDPSFDDDEVEITFEQFGRNVTQRVQRFQFFVQVSGSLELLSIRPMSGPLSYPSSVTLEGNDLVFTYNDSSRIGAVGIKKQFENDLTVVRQGIENLKSSMTQQNLILKTFGTGAVAQRRAQLAQQADAIRDIGFPRRREPPS